MTNPQAAYPGQDDPRSIEKIKYQPGEARVMGCPNCKETDGLQTVEAVTAIRDVILYEVGVTLPEVDSDDDDLSIDTAKPMNVIGLRCTTCKWGYEGPDALHQAVVVDA